MCEYRSLWITSAGLVFVVQAMRDGTLNQRGVAGYIVIRRCDVPATARRAVVSKAFGVIALPSPGRSPDGRSGHHWPEGSNVAAGDYIKTTSGPIKRHIVELSPTLFHLLNIPQPPEFTGKKRKGPQIKLLNPENDKFRFFRRRG